nr:MAG TPA: hypothetical protein [Caudoviricetes sp.]
MDTKKISLRAFLFKAKRTYVRISSKKLRNL